MPLQQSSLITRKQLACISGGTVDKKKCPNVLKLGTPFTYCGGRSYALKDHRVHHICVKEEMNLPFPDCNTKELAIHKYTPKKYDGTLPTEIQAMKDTPHVVPIFLEPKDQSARNGVDSGKVITYVGHWNVTEVLKKKDMYKGQHICAKTFFQFDRFDEEFSKYIEYAHDKPISELITIENFDHLETLGDSDDDDSNNKSIQEDQEASYDDYSDNDNYNEVEKFVPTTPTSLCRLSPGSIKPLDSMEALESLGETQEEKEQEASDADYSENDSNNDDSDENSIDTVEKSVPTTPTSLHRSISLSRNPQESIEASEVMGESHEEIKEEEIKKEDSDDDYSNNEDEEEEESSDTVGKSVSTTSLEASEIMEDAQGEIKEEEIKEEEIKEEDSGDYYSNNEEEEEEEEEEESIDTVEKYIPLHQVAVDATHTSTHVSRSVQKVPNTSESNLPVQEVICLDSSSDEEDAKQSCAEEDDNDSIIEDVTSAQSNLKRDPDFEEEYFLVRHIDDTSDKMVHIAKKQKTTFLDMRNAVNSQVDPRCGQYNFHIPDRNLDICHRQELYYEIKQFLKGGSGTFDDPYQKV